MFRSGTGGSPIALQRRAFCVALAAPLLSVSARVGATVPTAELEVIKGCLGAAQGRFPNFKVIAVATAAATSQEIFGGRTPSPSDFQEHLPKAPQALIEGFLDLVRFPNELDATSLARPGLRVYPASDAKLSQLFDKQPAAQGWRDFRAAFPGAQGLVRVSRPVVDRNSNHALLFMSMTPEGPGGSGHLYHLQRKGSRWSIVEDFQTWVG